ncbi:MAG TPA: hypothetical protein ENI44_04050 [Thermoplasmatales archaeon]|nr:hypothetical protein [Thermoplasmatales archaeon]
MSLPCLRVFEDFKEKGLSWRIKDYNSMECFNEITGFDSTPGIRIRDNASAKAGGSPGRKQFLLRKLIWKNGSKELVTGCIP